MKTTVAKIVTRHVSWLLVAAMLILFVGAYFMVSRIVYEENEKYALAVLGIYTDLLVEESHEKHIPIDAEHSERVITYGETLCDWYAVDYVYLYTIDEAKSTATYIAASAVDGKVENPPRDHLVGYSVECELHPEELAVWRGEKFVGHITANNKLGHEVSTLLRIEDDFGNKMIAGVDVAYRDIHQKILRTFVLLAIIIAAVLAGVFAAVHLIIRKRVSRPAQAISDSMHAFITDGVRSDIKLDVGSGEDEYTMIANSFEEMKSDIDKYLANISSLTREQERRNTELDIASHIQRGFLPAEKFEKPQYEIHAGMEPALDVGGDLYDYMPLGDGRAVLVVADVSGKGISAAMVMAVTLTLIRQFAKLDLPPDEILRRTNDALTEKNAAMMFATAFVGIYDSAAGTFTYSNAGHNRPYIIGMDGVKKLDDAAGVLLGLYPGEKYVSASVPVRSGDTIFMYTDGVNEATDGERRFFGMERLESVLSGFTPESGGNIADAVKAAVKDFTGSSELHDDITVLALTARGGCRMELAADVHELEKIKRAILALPVPRQTQLDLCVAAEECFVNICSYAFEGGAPDGEKVDFSLDVTDRVTMRFTDGGVPYDPLADVSEPDDYDIDIQTGGLGKFLVGAVTDGAEYEYRDGKNVLTITKKFEEETK